MYAFVQEIVETKYYSRITSLLEIIGQCTTIMAGAFATLLLEGTEKGILKIFGLEISVGWNVESWQIHEIFLMDSITYFIAFTVILAIKYVPIAQRKIESGSLINRLKTGINYLKGHKSVFWFGILSYGVFIAVLLEAFYLGVSYVKNNLEQTGDVYANSKMAYASGAILSGILIRYLFKRVNIPKNIIVLTVITGLVFLNLSLSKSVTVFFAMMLLIGIANAGIRVSRITYLFRNVPNQYFGRTGSIFFIFNVICRIVLMAIFINGFFQEDDNIIYVYMSIGALLLLTASLLVYHYKSFDLKLVE